MKQNRKLKLSVLNSLLLFIFLLVLTVSIFLVSISNTQKIVNKNIDDYFEQTFSFVKYVIKSQYEVLEDINYNLSSLINEYEKVDSNLAFSLNNIDSINDIDIIYYKTKNNSYDFSNSLFETEKLMEKILNEYKLIDSKILSIKYKSENYLIMLDSLKVIDEKIGRVKGTIYTGKILNDNFSFLNEIKEEAKLDSLYIYFDNKKIASTNFNKDLNLENLKSRYIKADKIFVKKELKIKANEPLEFILVSKNGSFEVLKESFFKQAVYLVIAVIVIFFFLYYLSNIYIIEPFKHLVKYANSIKKYDNTTYKASHVEEFDEFAYELKDIITELKDLKEKYSRAIDGVQDGLWDIDLETKEIYYSKRFKTMLGYDENERLNYRSFWQKSIHKEDYKNSISKLKDHLSFKTNIFETEYRFRCKNGSYKWIKVRGKAFFNSDNRPYRISGFHTDINDLIELRNENLKKEQMLYQQSKLAAMGEMIGNIAHQWRQPLTVISVISSTLNMQIQLGIMKNDEAKKDLDKLQDTVKYLSSIIDKFRNFFNPNNKKEEFILIDVIKDNLEIFESTYKSHNIDLKMDIQNDIKINGYKFELMQVVINIINNAKDALIQNVSTKENRTIYIDAYNEKNSVNILIYDNAGGIPSNIKEKIYEPYFTTKHKSQGTGLGLYMSNEIIQKHFRGELSNKTISFIHNDKEVRGEEFKIIVPIG